MPSSKAVCPGRATKVFASELRPSLHIRIFAPTSQRLRPMVLFLPAAKPKISFAENGTTPVNAVVPFLMQVTKQSIAVGFVILQTTPCLRAPSANTQSLHRSQPPRQLRPPLALISPPDYVLSLSCPTRLERLACPISKPLKPLSKEKEQSLGPLVKKPSELHKPPIYVQQCYVKWFWTISSLGAPV